MSRDNDRREGEGLNSVRIRVEAGLEVVQRAVDLMNNNQFMKAEELLKPRSSECMFHSLAYGTVVFLQAAFGMDREVIERATLILTNTVDICNRCRRSRGMMETLSSWIFGQQLGDYNLEELTAELFYAEANLLLSFLTFVQEEGLMGFVKGALRIRSCHSLYKQLYHWLKVCEREGVAVDISFASGVSMGYGCFNLFLSLLPARVLRLLQFAGFSGDRAVGLRELERGAASGTFRAPLCSSFLLFYHTIAAVITGIEIDADHSERLLKPQLVKYPSSVQFMYFQGRIRLMRGQVDQAMESFHSAISSQDEWHQVKHLCWWELVWCHVMKSEWEEAAKYSSMLYHESRWSKTSFLYMGASFSLMAKRLRHRESVSEVQLEDGDQVSVVPQENEGPSCENTRDQVHQMLEGTEASMNPSIIDTGSSSPGRKANGEHNDRPSGGEEDDPIASFMKDVPRWKQRLAGKSIPIEQFSVAKSQRYMEGARLPLCGLELMYSNNLFVLLRKNKLLLHGLLEQVQVELRRVELTASGTSGSGSGSVVAIQFLPKTSASSNSDYVDDLCVCNLVKGCILRALEEYDEAKGVLHAVVQRKGEVKKDLYSVPAATAELGLLLLDMGGGEEDVLVEAEAMLDEARTQYKAYTLENRIHFRIHEGRNRIRAHRERR